VNDPPTITLPESFTFDEDGSLVVDFTGYVDDIDEDGLTLTVSDNDSVTVNIVDFSVTFGAVQDWNGTETLTFTINDNQGRDIAVDEVEIIVSPVNDAPVLDSIGVQETDEDVSLTIAISAGDVDDTELAFSVSSDNDAVTVSITGDSLTMVPALNYNGSAGITVTVSDGILADSETFELTVTPVNDPPTITLPESFTFDEDGSLVVDFTGYVDDIDEDGLTLTVSDNDSVTVNIVDFSVTFGAVQDWNGSEIITFTVNDNQGGEASDNVDVIVTPVNDAPVLSVIADTSTAEDIPLTMTLSGEDVENAELSFNASSDNDTVAVSIAGDQLTITPALNYFGTANITVTVSDGFLTDSETFILTVNAVNDAPSANNDTYVTLEETTLIVEEPGVLMNDGDVDGDILFVILVSDVENGTLTLDSLGSFVYQPADGFNGFDNFIYEVSDGNLSDTANVIIDVGAENDAPIANNDIYNTEEDEILTVDAPGVLLNDSDEDLDTLYTELYSNAIHGDVVLNSDGSFIYEPNGNYNGSDEFIYRAFDGYAYSNFDTVSITIVPINDAPVITGQVALVTLEDTPLEITLDNLLVTDVDNIYPDNFTMTVLSGDNYTVEGTTITPDSDFDQDITVPVFVDDGEAADSLSNTF
ncbi:uncharacterized protein METZ01_LOCUS139168, partial [marine metagenome]